MAKKPAQAKYKNGKPVKVRDPSQRGFTKSRAMGASLRDLEMDDDYDWEEEAPKHYEMDPAFDTCLDGVDVDADDFNPMAYISLRQGEVIPPLPLPTKMSEWLKDMEPIHPRPGLVGRTTTLTHGKAKRLLHYIRNGAFDYVACEAVGIVPVTFYRWLREGKDESSVYHTLYIEVMKARSIARAGAEMTVRKDNPQAWLRYGPGRDRNGRPGWTESVQQNSTVDHKVSVAEIIRQNAKMEKRGGPEALPPSNNDTVIKVDDEGVW